MNILVFDDQPDLAEDWAEQIRTAVGGDGQVSVMTEPDEELELVVARKIAIKENVEVDTTSSAFDQLDVLVVDFDLVFMDKKNGRTTGEGLARLMRTYSTCGAIVVMNQYKGAPFDLGMRGHLDSFADLNVADSLISQDALWRDVDPVPGLFNPTTWTALPTLVGCANLLTQMLADDGCDRSVVELLGLGQEALPLLSDTAYGFLSPTAQDASALSKVTVGDFLQFSLDDREFAYAATFAAYADRFAAFRLLKWLERAVCRPMNVLIDAGHLIERMPFLLNFERINVSQPDDWTVGSRDPSTFLNQEIVKTYRNDPVSNLLGRDIFDWYLLENDESVIQLQDQAFDSDAERFLYSETTSRFLSPEVAGENLVHFRADFHNFGDRRSFERVEGIECGPSRRIKFG